MYVNCKYEGFSELDDLGSLSEDVSNQEKTIVKAEDKVTTAFVEEDTILNSTIKDDFLKNTATFDKADFEVVVEKKLDGNSDKNAYPSAIIPQIVRTFRRYRGQSGNSIQSANFPDGYYWIKFNEKSTQYIYCIMNEAYYGGGWMLAMRAVKNSTTFKYDSEYWTGETVLNSDYDTIKKVLQKTINTDLTTQLNIQKNEELQSISSIGNAIYRADLNASEFDIKTDAFNSYNAREWLAVFYFKDRNGAITRGGDYISRNEGGKTKDDMEISTENKNTRGWIWRELARSTRKDGEPEPMRELFYNRRVTSTGLSNTNNHLDFLAKYGIGHVQGLNKWRRKDTDTGTPLWSGQEGFNFYGINWEHPTTAAMWGGGRQFKVRWGFIWNNEGHEIYTSDCSCGIGMAEYSCRDEWRWDGTQFKGCNESIAYEIYVR